MNEAYRAGEGYVVGAVQPDLCCCKGTSNSAATEPVTGVNGAHTMPINKYTDAAAKLREMMERDSGENKCELCKAAELLEKKDSGGNPLMAFPLLMLGMMWGGNGAVDPTVLRAMADAMEKEADKSGK